MSYYQHRVAANPVQHRPSHQHVCLSCTSGNFDRGGARIQPQPRQPPSPPTGQHSSSRSDLDIFYQLSPVTDYLYVSGARAVQFSRIVERGITCIVNATIELPNLPIPNVDYLKVPVDDTPYSNLYAYFDIVADKIAEVRRRGGKTLVHCVAGISRSVSLCIAYLMKYEGMPLRKAYHYIKGRRPIAHPNHGFFKQLLEYEKRLFGHESVKMVHVPHAGVIPDVYEEMYRNLMWMSSGGKALDFK